MKILPPIQLLDEKYENMADFYFNKRGSLPEIPFVEVNKVKNYFSINEKLPIAIRNRCYYDWTIGSLKRLPLLEGKTTKFDSNPWNDFFSFTNSLFRDYFFDIYSLHPIREDLNNQQVEEFKEKRPFPIRISPAQREERREEWLIRFNNRERKKHRLAQ